MITTVSPGFAEDVASATTKEISIASAAPSAATTYGLFDPTRPCTGVLVDARHLTNVRRCQSPVLLAETLESNPLELYPDPNCLPNLQVLQEEGIVRFYHSVEQARKGFVGDNPYIVRAAKLSGPFSGDLVVSKEDAILLRELETRIHYTRTWHVGFLLPEAQ